ncbi:MAG: DEAD/DEAH box helicase [Streptosporangiales bacterium]|nr:DEAD/DEAH box helicase [Streptosporangiales bacterium]
MVPTVEPQTTSADPADLIRQRAASRGTAEHPTLTHLEEVPARAGTTTGWPAWLPAECREQFVAAGVPGPWQHQVDAAEHAWSGRSVVVATGTASGKTLAYLLPVSATAAADAGTGLYLAPTKALARDQLRSLHELELPGLRPAVYDGDTSYEERQWVRRHANYVLTNPDMLHHGLLARHEQWAAFLRRLQYVVVDECHHYRGVFGSHVAQVLRRLRRVCAKYGSEPVFALASATVSSPAHAAGRLTGVEVAAVTDDASPRGATSFALWEPPLTELTGENGAPVRRSATGEAADLLADLVCTEVRTLAFVRSRRGAEVVAMEAKRHVGAAVPQLQGRVAAYRGGYLPEERRELERRLANGSLLGVSTTNALELGIDIAGLDAVLIVGWPGTRASLWQQVGRAGRAGQRALAVLVARDDPLDTYLVHHPQALFGQPVEETVLDPDNPYVLAPHLCSAAAELPLTPAGLAVFGDAAPEVVAELERRGQLRRRKAGWFWTGRGRAHDLADLRGSGGVPVSLVEDGTGRLLGTVDTAAAHNQVHTGAVYLHQGETYLVQELDLDDAAAFVERADPEYTTTARELTDISIVEQQAGTDWGDAQLCTGTVEVTQQVVGFLRRHLATREVLGEEPLDLPARTLRTRAVWWTLPADAITAAGIEPADLPGAAHAAEHASIGLLPLFATCDRWDVGGVSTALHEDTGRPTVFVYDGHPGGAGFAERGYAAAREWLAATRDAIAACECETGCPSCVQSPKCGNGNDPLDKRGAVRLLDLLLES